MVVLRRGREATAVKLRQKRYVARRWFRSTHVSSFLDAWDSNDAFGMFVLWAVGPFRLFGLGFRFWTLSFVFLLGFGFVCF